MSLKCIKIALTSRYKNKTNSSTILKYDETVETANLRAFP